MGRVAFSILIVAMLIPSVVFHEVAHAYAADRFGDDTARKFGRVSLNPVRHVDPIGTLVVPIVMLIATPFVFAWAKPVPVLPMRLRSPRVHSLFVALAGPAANFAIAGLAIGLFHLLQPADRGLLWTALGTLVLLNVVLGVFNLLPIPPLDGSALIEFLLPRSALPTWYKIRPYTIVLVLALVILGRSWLEPLGQWAIDLWDAQQ